MQSNYHSNESKGKAKNDGAKKIEKGNYRSLNGYLMYLIATRPKILHAISVLSRFLTLC